jgi:hypothetical protein
MRSRYGFDSSRLSPPFGSRRGLYHIAEREAHQRAMARAVLSLERGRDYDDVMGALPKTEIGGV